jgi:hypothetical protein
LKLAGYILFLVVMLLVFPSSLAPSVNGSTVIVFDAVYSNSCNPCPTLSWSHTVGSGSNGILIVGVSMLLQHAPTAVTVTYGASTLTFIGAQNDPSDFMRAEMWYLPNPPTGTAPITVTFSAPGSQLAAGGSVSYFNVASVGSSNSVNGAGSLASVTVNANPGDLVVDTLVADSLPPITPGAGQTQRWSLSPSAGWVGAGSDKTAASPVTMTWNLVPVSKWALVAVQLQPSPPPVPVGGTLLAINPMSVLGAWAAILTILTILPVIAFTHKRRTHHRE